MKKSHRFLLTTVILGAIAGCYSYPDPPIATLGESYTQRQKDGADELFQGMTCLSLADAQRIALINNPTYIAAHHSVSAAHMRYLQSFSGYMPTVTAQVGYTGSNSWSMIERPDPGIYTARHPRTESNQLSTSVRATLLLFDGLIREFSVLEASHSEKYYQNMDDDACRTLAQSVAYAYNNVLLAIENRRIALEDRKFQVTSLKDTKYKFDAGTVPLSDVLNFEILMNNADVKLIAADYQYETAVYSLAMLMGYPDGVMPAEVSFSDSILPEYTELPAVEIFLDTALANRPDLKAYREQLEVAKYKLYQSYGSFSPTASAFVNFGYNLGENRYPDRSYTTHTYSESPSISYGVTADWVIFSGFARYNKMREYQANVAVAEYNVAAQWFKVVNEVRTAYAGCIQSIKAAKLNEKIRDLSAQQRDLVAEEYHAGNTELTRLNEAQRDYVEAEASLASSYVNIQNSRAQLDAAVGANTADFYLNRASTAKTGGESVTPEMEKKDDQRAEKDIAADTKLQQQTGGQPITPTPENPVVPAGKADAPEAPAPANPANPAAPAIPPRADAPASGR